MGFGQYSTGGGIDRTKGDMLAIFDDAADPIVTSRKGGKNRLDFTRQSGERGFSLHETVVATLSADGKLLTLADGGWHTPTTKTAWHDACKAFFGRKVHTPEQDRSQGPYCDWPRDADDDGSGQSGFSWIIKARTEVVASYPSSFPGKAERSVTYQVEPGETVGTYTFTRTEASADHPMIRASTDDGNFAVRFTGKAIVSEAGANVRCTPFKALVTLRRIDQMLRDFTGAKQARGVSFEAFGFTIEPGRFGRIVLIGCHAFRTDDIRAAMRRIAGEHPAADKAARAFCRKHLTDFGAAAWEAANRANLASARRAATIQTAYA